MALRFFITKLLFFLLFVVTALALHIFDNSNMCWSIFTLSLDLYLGLMMVYQGISLLYLMKNYHNHEYHIHKWSIMSVGLFSALLLVYKTFSLTFEAEENFNIQSVALLRVNARDYWLWCHGEGESKPKDVVDLVFLYTKMPETLIVLLIVLLKKPKDVLQGINKLDYFLKIS